MALDGTEIRPLTDDDMNKVLSFIDMHDDDDAEEAFKSFDSQGLGGHYVITLNGEPVGISGAREMDDCDRSFNLSWTYVHPEHCGKGYGRRLLDYVLHQLKQHNARKLFCFVSDYVDEDGNDVYANAVKLYKSVGFEPELEIKDYYDEDESLTIFSLTLQEPAAERLPIAAESPKIKFNELFTVADTESTMTFGWKTIRFGRNFSDYDLLTGIEAAKNQGATMLVLSFPSNFDNVRKPLTAAGFVCEGTLQNYYEDGLDEVHYSYRFDS